MPVLPPAEISTSTIVVLFHSMVPSLSGKSVGMVKAFTRTRSTGADENPSLIFLPWMDGCSEATLRLLTNRGSSFHLVENAEDGAEDGVRYDDGERSANAVVHGHEAGRLEHAMRLGAVLLARHARMHTGQHGHDRDD